MSLCNVPRRPAQITQADIVRVIRAAKQAGAVEVEIRLCGEATCVVRLTAKESDRIILAPQEEVVL